MSDEPIFARVAIVGVGLMGGSLAWALKHYEIATTVVGIDTDTEALRLAYEMGAIDKGYTDIAEGVKDANLVIFAVPVSLVVPLMERAASSIRHDSIVTDLASVKAQIVPVGERLFGSRFVSSHPMAGSEKKGITAARVDLFKSAAWFIIYGYEGQESSGAAHLEGIYSTSIESIRLLVSRLGARSVLATAKKHDELVALVSHLPHVLSFGFARAFEQSETPGKAREVAGGSFRDIMRVANANPALWADILYSNREALRPTLDATLTEIERIRNLLDAPDSTPLKEYLEKKR